MAKSNYFAAKAAMEKINANIKAAHPDWDSKRVYAATKALYNKSNKTETEAPVEETVAEEVAEPAIAVAEEQ